MLRYVDIQSLIQLQAFERKVQRPSFLSPRSPEVCGRRVRHLCISGYEEDPGNSSAHVEEVMQWTCSMVAILIACPLLQGFTLLDLPLTRACTACLVLASDHLVTLSLLVDFEQLRSDGIFEHIQQLRGLMQLYIAFDTFDADLVQDVLETQSVLHLPKLKSLSWVIRDMEAPACRAVLRYLSRCRFPSAVEVKLDIVSVFPQQARLLIPFFDTHHIQIFTLLCAESFMAKIIPQLTRIEELHLPLTAPPLTLLESAELPSQITLYIDPKKDDADTTRFWNGLKRIPSRTARGGKISTLHILTEQDLDHPHSGYGRRFEWTDGADVSHSAFIGRLMTEAMRLYREGVIIVDGQGRDITGLVEKDEK
jgi:hypothetical protein